jgi:UDP-N-acetylmuramoyl-L-alanyl-D-glutamate--2,6-diaminopimelate ligase
MKLKKLIKDIAGIEVKGSKEIEITGICAHSKQVVPGNLFIAKKGLTVDGAQFIHEAVTSGAVAILTDFFDPTLKAVTQLIYPDISVVEGKIAAAFYQYPSSELLMVGITGTNGKTTTSYLIKHLLDYCSLPCGMIGTIAYMIGDHQLQATHTTPDVTANQKLLREMLHQDCKAAVMEVTSHALDQGRVNGIDYDVTIFTNLTKEHLDYHKTMEAYGEAKSRLFVSTTPFVKKRHPYPKAAIFNKDDSYTSHLLGLSDVPSLTFGIESEEVDVKASAIEMSSLGSSFKVTYKNENCLFVSPLIGRYNVYNCLAAIACGLSQEIPLSKIAEAFKSFTIVPGRLEPVFNSLGLKIFVDFSHKPDALKSVLESIQEWCSGRILTVFGCGGNRDPFKRPQMAAIAEKYSTITVVTSDNPRLEDPEKIIEEIMQGFSSRERVLVEPDRKKAIEKAISLARPEDVVLIAGRGHETHQIFAHQTIELDDRVVAREICEKRV